MTRNSSHSLAHGNRPCTTFQAEIRRVIGDVSRDSKLPIAEILDRRRAGRPLAILVRRAVILRCASKGYSIASIAREMSLNRATVLHTIRKYHKPAAPPRDSARIAEIHRLKALGLRNRNDVALSTRLTGSNSCDLPTQTITVYGGVSVGSLSLAGQAGVVKSGDSHA